MSEPDQSVPSASVTAGVFPVSTLVGLAIVPHLLQPPLLLCEAIIAAAIVTLLTWVLMPIVTRVLHHRLFPDARPSTECARAVGG